MITLEENNIPLASFNYGKISSEVRWFPENKSSVEFLNLKENIFLLRGSKEYYITDIYGDAEFRERYGSDIEDYHSRLASIGTFSDYLKKEVASFDLSVFYINSLSSGIVPFDASPLGPRPSRYRRHHQDRRRQIVWYFRRSNSRCSSTAIYGTAPSHLPEIRRSFVLRDG